MTTSRLRTSVLAPLSLAAGLSMAACGGGPTSLEPGGASGAEASGSTAASGTTSASGASGSGSSGTAAPPVGASDFESAPAPGLNAGALGVGGGVAETNGAGAATAPAAST